MENLLKSLIAPLVDNIDKVTIEKEESGENIKYKIRVPQNDIAKVIGKNGKMIKSIKNLIKIRSIKEGIYAHLEIVES